MAVRPRNGKVKGQIRKHVDVENMGRLRKKVIIYISSIPYDGV